jgi:transposase
LKLIAGGRYSIDFAVEVCSEKYLDHAPLARQARKMTREGLIMDTQTLWDQVSRVARVVEPAHARLHAYLLSKSLLGADETTWRLMGNANPSGKKWQVWTLASEDAVYYRLQDSRGTQAAANVLGGYGGIVMCDGYKAYSDLAKQRGSPFMLVHCWAHVRRKFVEIESSFPEETEQILDLIKELYAIERSCPSGPGSDELRAKLRDERSRSVVGDIKAWATTVQARSESGLDKAIKYMTGIWSGLVRFLDDPRIPLDNNLTERANRGPVVGRKNHYGSRSRWGTEAAAILYSLLESAKLCGINPTTYLRDAVVAGLEGEQIPLPHEVRAALVQG